MKFKLEIECDSAAFDPPYVEVGRILDELASKLYAGQSGINVRDANGNRVGRAYFEEANDCPTCPNCGIGTDIEPEDTFRKRT